MGHPVAVFRFPLRLRFRGGAGGDPEPALRGFHGLSRRLLPPLQLPGLSLRGHSHGKASPFPGGERPVLFRLPPPDSGDPAGGAVGPAPEAGEDLSRPGGRVRRDGQLHHPELAAAPGDGPDGGALLRDTGGDPAGQRRLSPAEGPGGIGAGGGPLRPYGARNRDPGDGFFRGSAGNPAPEEEGPGGPGGKNPGRPPGRRPGSGACRGGGPPGGVPQPGGPGRLSLRAAAHAPVPAGLAPRPGAGADPGVRPGHGRSQGRDRPGPAALRKSHPAAAPGKPAPLDSGGKARPGPGGPGRGPDPREAGPGGGPAVGAGPGGTAAGSRRLPGLPGQPRLPGGPGLHTRPGPGGHPPGTGNHPGGDPSPGGGRGSLRPRSVHQRHRLRRFRLRAGGRRSAGPVPAPLHRRPYRHRRRGPALRPDRPGTGAEDRRPGDRARSGNGSRRGRAPVSVSPAEEPGGQLSGGPGPPPGHSSASGPGG
ncbi:MAG: hypothetical protein BWY88_00524 [Synergistetes bacterium ADurb.Bin520]|nr:MAG: hypothetical protein BWY88_00524 [Synergistetes bacterium ADurb.Bin520]